MARTGFIFSIFIVAGLLALAACAKSVERSEGATPTSVPVTSTPNLTPLPTATATPVPSPTPTPVPIPTATSTVISLTPTPTAVVTPAATATPVATPAAAATPVPSPEATPTTAPIGGELADGLFLKITNFPKESVVRTSTIELAGVTSPDALVSVNGVLVDVDANGGFMATVTLKEQPNLVEVIASDFRGNQVSAVLTIIYIP